jgi:hypothetical protein
LTTYPIATKSGENFLQPHVLEHDDEIQNEHPHLDETFVPIDLTIPDDGTQHDQVDDEKATVA